MRVRATAELVQAARTALGLSSGGIVHLEHINLVVGEPELTEAFYFAGLGLTRDPQRSHGSTIWANAGWHQQFHLVRRAEGEACQVVNGVIGLAVPNLAKVRDSLAAVVAAGTLDRTQFAVGPKQEEGAVGAVGLEVTCPYGNVFHVFQAGSPLPDIPLREPADGMSKFERMYLNEHAQVSAQPGIPFVLFRVAPGSAAAIGAHYTAALGATTAKVNDSVIAVSAGANGAVILFVEASVDPDAVAKQHGLHVCIYVSQFEESFCRVTAWTNPKFRALDRCDTLEQARGSRQFRFKDVAGVFELEHETRALTHSCFMQPLTYLQ